MGSPMVFQTAPPQPLSKARMICSPQLVGGPEANQNGLGLRMPAKLVVRSAMLVFVAQALLPAGSRLVSTSFARGFVPLPERRDESRRGRHECPRHVMRAQADHSLPPIAIAIAARFPSATASTTSRPPLTQSPPA